MKITGRELVACRALIGLNQKQLALLAGVNPDTLNRLETSGANAIKARELTVEKLLTVLGQHGVALAPGRIIHVA
jgi:transcriptional regulator with XRE-family HTH domain